MEKLAGVEGLIVSQSKEWAEILTGFETRNKYVVMDTPARRSIRRPRKGARSWHAGSCGRGVRSASRSARWIVRAC